MQKFILTDGSNGDINAQFPREGKDFEKLIVESTCMDSDEIIINRQTIPSVIKHGDRFQITFFALYRRDDNASEYVADLVKLNEEFLLVEIYPCDSDYEAILVEGEDAYGLTRLTH